ncbi:anthranilate synthase component I family protein [Paenibacillus sp. GCM10023252]|uniref:anthranilate synthase component I family protein n=1 Tax=Paenibacillus sp. GCM10023252 TaxID=3252649 RepID=UPI0036094D1A
MLPVVIVHKLPAGASRIRTWERAWEQAAPYSFVLESGKDGRYTYFGLRPVSVIRGNGDQGAVTDIDCGGEARAIEAAPLDAVRQWMSSYTAPKLAGEGPKWTGGCIGYWSYDVIRSIERLPHLAADDLGVPDYLFMQVNELWVIDHEQELIYCAVQTPVSAGTGTSIGTLGQKGHSANTHEHDTDAVLISDSSGAAAGTSLQQRYEAAVQQAHRMAQLWEELFETSAGGRYGAQSERRQQALERDSTMAIDVESVSGIQFSLPKESFMEAVQAIQRYIGQGDVFQVNLSLRQSMRTEAQPEELYEWLRLVNPSPYMGLLRCPDFQLVSASPELLVEKRGDRLITRPIAGTRRRGRTEAEDREMAAELHSSEKERAEHIMLVDLERNDLGRISRYGTVEVKELMVIESYSHVMHLVSQVEGQLAEGKDAYDVIAATFPGGTITGAPKIRTMEIIEELEPVRRGPYTGSMGWIDYNGDMEFNIIIRTMTVKDGTVHIQSGAGIVIDSEPEREYYESLSKAKALWKAIQFSEQLEAVEAIEAIEGIEAIEAVEGGGDL